MRPAYLPRTTRWSAVDRDDPGVRAAPQAADEPGGAHARAELQDRAAGRHGAGQLLQEAAGDLVAGPGEARSHRVVAGPPAAPEHLAGTPWVNRADLGSVWCSGHHVTVWRVRCPDGATEL